jgi:DUF971 family protein
LTGGRTASIFRAMGLLDRVTFKGTPASPPEAIDVTPQGEIHIAWPDAPEATIPAVALRDACPCAECIEEGTGRKVLDRAAIPADIRPLAIEPVGNYAVRIQWSDGHGHGIYTWQVLRQV